MLSIQSLIIKHKSHLPIHPSQLGIVAILGGGVSTIDGFVIVLQGHRCLALLVESTSHQIVGQHAVVGCAVLVKIVHVRLNTGWSKRLVCAVELVDAVESAAHGSITASSRAAAQG